MVSNVRVSESNGSDLWKRWRKSTDTNHATLKDMDPRLFGSVHSGPNSSFDDNFACSSLYRNWYGCIERISPNPWDFPWNMFDWNRIRDQLAHILWRYNHRKLNSRNRAARSSFCFTHHQFGPTIFCRNVGQLLTPVDRQNWIQTGKCCWGWTLLEQVDPACSLEYRRWKRNRRPIRNNWNFSNTLNSSCIWYTLRDARLELEHLTNLIGVLAS